MTAIETLKQWFSNLKKPTQEQFWAWLDSFWHKSEKIPMASVEGLDKLVEGTASAEQLSNHLNDSNAHRTLFDQKVDKVEGKELSSNDFTNEYKEKLDTLQPTDTSELLPKGGYEGTGKELKDAIDSLQTKMGQVETTLSVDDTDFDTLQEIATQVKSNKNLETLLIGKVDKQEGKGLSSNDFTNEHKQKLEGLQPNEVSSKLKYLEKILTIYEDGGIISGIGFEDKNNHSFGIYPSTSDFLSTFDRFDIASAVHTKIGGGDVIVGSSNPEDSTDESRIMLRTGQLMFKYKNIEFDCPEEKRLVTNGELKALESRIAALEAKG